MSEIDQVAAELVLFLTQGGKVQLLNELVELLDRNSHTSELQCQLALWRDRFGSGSGVSIPYREALCMVAEDPNGEELMKQFLVREGNATLVLDCGCVLMFGYMSGFYPASMDHSATPAASCTAFRCEQHEGTFKDHHTTVVEGPHGRVYRTD